MLNVFFILFKCLYSVSLKTAFSFLFYISVLFYVNSSFEFLGPMLGNTVTFVICRFFFLNAGHNVAIIHPQAQVSIVSISISIYCVGREDYCLNIHFLQ